MRYKKGGGDIKKDGCVTTRGVNHPVVSQDDADGVAAAAVSVESGDESGSDGNES